MSNIGYIEGSFHYVQSSGMLTTLISLTEGWISNGGSFHGDLNTDCPQRAGRGLMLHASYSISVKETLRISIHQVFGHYISIVTFLL